MKNFNYLTSAAAALVTVTTLGMAPSQAANHREAPITALDHKADITDVFAFVSYDPFNTGKVTLILDVDPLLEPSNGPTYFPFDPEITYRINIDNDHDAREDIRFEFRFKTEIRLPRVFTVAVGAGDGIPAPDNAPLPALPGPVIPPAITALDGPGSQGLGLRQTYSVMMIKGKGKSAKHTLLAKDLIAVPTNVGPRTMPDYPSLANQGIFDLDNGINVFAGTVEDPFWIDLGAAFDSLNFRPAAFDSGIPGVLSDRQDAADNINFAPDDVAGFNVNAIAIQMPIEMLTSDGQIHTADESEATIGVWGTTSRSKFKILRGPGKTPLTFGSKIQIQRMANPLINELIIGVGSKDKFSMSKPKNDQQFADFVLDPYLARAFNAIYGIDLPPTPRVDLLPLVQYLPPIAAEGTPKGPIADLLRLNTGVTPTPADQINRLGLLGGDPAGFPNGRRLQDDVVDLAARVVAGVLAAGFNISPNNLIGDGVNRNDVRYRDTFPYLGFAHSGVESRHVDPTEDGCNPICPSVFD